MCFVKPCTSQSQYTKTTNTKAQFCRYQHNKWKFCDRGGKKTHSHYSKAPLKNDHQRKMAGRNMKYVLDISWHFVILTLHQKEVRCLLFTPIVLISYFINTFIFLQKTHLPCWSTILQKVMFFLMDIDIMHRDNFSTSARCQRKKHKANLCGSKLGRKDYTQFLLFSLFVRLQ